MAIQRAEFEVVASVKPDSEGAAIFHKHLDDAKGKAEALREKMHELREEIHVVSKNTGELGHILHYVLSPEAFASEALFVAIKELKDYWSDLNQVVKDFNDLEDKISTDKIDAVAKSLREAKIAAAEFHAEMLKHGNPEDERPPEQQVHALMTKYGIAGGGSPEEQIAQLRKVAGSNAASAQAGEHDNSAVDADNLAAAQKALDDFHGKMIPHTQEDIDAYTAGGATTALKQVAEEAAEETKLKARAATALDLQRIDDANLKHQQSHTEDVRKQGESDADTFAKLTGQIAAGKKKKDDATGDQIASDASTAIAAGGAGMQTGAGYTTAGQFDEARIRIGQLGAAAFNRGDAAQVQQLGQMALALHEQYESKFRQHEQQLARQAQQLQAILQRMKNGNASSSTR